MRIASIEDRKADTCMQRNKGAEEAFLKAVPDFKPENIVRVAYDNTMVNSIDVMTTTLTANPERRPTGSSIPATTTACSAPHARSKMPATRADQGMGIGIDGSRACDAFGSGKPSAFRGTMWLNSANHGALAVKLLLASIKDKTALPVQSFTDPGIHHGSELRLGLQGQALPLKTRPDDTATGPAFPVPSLTHRASGAGFDATANSSRSNMYRSGSASCRRWTTCRSHSGRANCWRWSARTAPANRR